MKGDALLFTPSMSADAALVTGATGFVGSAVIRRVIASGFSVRALVRHRSVLSNLTGLDVRLFTGDLRDPDSIRAAICGVRYVFHVAADYRLWAPDQHEILASNVAGTQNIMQEALRARVERVIYTSSVGTLALRADGAPADEARSLRVDEGFGAYKRSKIAAEELVRTMAVRDRLPVVIVNPSAPIGPRDRRPTPTGRIIVEAAMGRMPAFVDTGLNLVHVDDVAEGHLAALHRGRIGERYILGGENVLLSEMLADIARYTHRHPPKLRLPWRAVLPIAYAAEFLASRTGREPFASVAGVRLAQHRMFFTAAKAERELGFQARPYRDGLEDAICWFRDNDYLRAPASFRRRSGWEGAPEGPKAST